MHNNTSKSDVVECALVAYTLTRRIVLEIWYIHE